MPDYTPQPEDQVRRLAEQLGRAKVAAAVHKSDRILDWPEVDGGWVDGDGRYRIEWNNHGYVGHVFQDGEPIYTSPAYPLWRFAADVLEAVETVLRFQEKKLEAAVVPDMEKTAEHQVLMIDLVDGIE